MVRYVSLSRGSSALRAPGTRLVGLMLGLALLLSIGFVQRLTPSEPQTTRTDSSCKPRPPYGVELVAAGDQQWTLILSNSAAAVEMVVWMWSEVDEAGAVAERRQVWAGTLDAASVQRIAVRYAPSSSAQRIWACVESSSQSQDLQAAALRGVAVAPGPAARATRKQTHVLTEDPESGRQVEQYVGQGGVQ